jgi:hypothetical protein
MQTLKQIVYLLDGNKLSKIDVLDNKNSESRYTQFYQLIKDGKIKTDEDAAQHFYQTTNTQNQNYRKFKSQFKEKLCNVIFFINTDDKHIGDYQNAYSDAQRTWALVNILFTRSMFIAAVDISEQLLKVCLHYEFTELIVQITDRLKHYYGTVEGDKVKYAHVRTLHFKHLDYLNAELLAKDLYQGIKIEYVKTIAFKRHMHDIAIKAVEELTPFALKCDSFTFMAFWYYIRIAACQTIYDHRNILATCEEGLKFFEQKKFETRKTITVLLNQKLSSEIQLRQYKDGKKTSERVLPLQTEGTHNWYKTLEQQMMLCFHTSEYGTAYSVYKTAIHHKGYGFLSGRNKEIWSLFSAYLYFLIKNKRIEDVLLEKSELKNFRLTKVSNDLNTISSDKNGLNIPTLIISFVLKLSADKDSKEKLRDDVEAMQKYISRHIKKTDAAYRSNAFMRLLTEVTNVAYSKKLIAPIAKKIMKAISESPLDIMEQGDRIEIMPFEDLWEEMQPFLRA